MGPCLQNAPLSILRGNLRIRYTPTTVVIIPKTIVAIFFGILFSIIVPKFPPPTPPITNNNEITKLI